MKKVFYSIALMMVAVFSSVLLTGCGDPEPQSLKIKADSVQTSVLVNDQFNTDGLKVIVTYDDGSTQTVSKNNDMTISSINTTQVGEQTLTVKYLGLTATLKINVYATESDKHKIMGYQPSVAYSKHLANKQGAGGDVKLKANDSRFAKNDSTYKVGDDNPFIFLPQVTVMDKDNPTHRFQVTQYSSIVTVKEKLKGQSTYNLLEGDALAEKVIIDTVNSTYDFTEQAIENTYQITVQPAQMTSASTYNPITIEVEVVNGWNVYDEYNLSRINSSATPWDTAEGSADSMWAAFKAEHGIGNEAIKSVVLHRDMVLTADHIPSTYIWGSDAVGHVGSLKDSKSLYTRDVPSNDYFNIYGNYFQISTYNVGDDAPYDGAQTFPLVTKFEHDHKVPEAERFGHSALFSFGGDNDHNPANTMAQGKVTIENLSLKGNGQKTSTKLELRGGLTAILSSASELTLNNCRTTAFTTHINANGSYCTEHIQNTFNTVVNIIDSKLIDSYSSMFMAWGAKQNNITRSVLKKSGGPLIIATHVGNQDDLDKYPDVVADMNSNVNVVDSLVESKVEGSEAWFANMGGGMATMLMSTYFRPADIVMKTISGELERIDGITKSGFVDPSVGTKGSFDFIMCSMGADNVKNTMVIGNTITVTEAGQTVSHSNMKDQVLAAYVAAIAGASGKNPESLTDFPFIFEADGVYLTFDFAKQLQGGDPMNGLALLCEYAADNTYGLPISLGDSLFTNDVYLDNQAEIDEMLRTFFNAEHINIILGGQRMCNTFKFIHDLA